MDSLAFTLKTYLTSPNFKEIDWRYWKSVSNYPPPRTTQNLYFHIRNMELPEIIEECIYFSIISQLSVLADLEVENPPVDFIVDEALNRIAKSEMYTRAYRIANFNVDDI